MYLDFGKLHQIDIIWFRILKTFSCYFITVIWAMAHIYVTRMECHMVSQNQEGSMLDCKQLFHKLGYFKNVHDDIPQRVIIICVFFFCSISLILLVFILLGVNDWFGTWETLGYFQPYDYKQYCSKHPWTDIFLDLAAR